MAAPSLGHAIGLNVKRKDIFGPAAQQLSENLAQWSAKKERAAKEKQDKQDKWLERAINLNQEAYQVRVEGDRQKEFNDFLSKINQGLESEATQQELFQIFSDFQTKNNNLKLISDKLKADEKSFYQNDAFIKPSVAKKIFGTPDQLTDDERLVAEALGYLDSGNNLFLVQPQERKPVNQTLADKKVEKEQLMAAIAQQTEEKAKFKAAEDKAAADAKKAKQPYTPKKFEESVTQITFRDKAIPGYVQTAGNLLTPEKTFFIQNIVNPLLDNDAFVENALFEYENKGNDLAAALRTAMAANNNNLDVAKAVVARDFVVENQYQPWADANAAFLEQNRRPASSGGGGGGGGKSDEVKGVRDITVQAHWSTAGHAAIKGGAWEGNVEELYRMKKAGTLGGGPASTYVGGYGPTVEFTGASSGEIYNIEGIGQVNPVSLYYDEDTKEFRLAYTTTISEKGMNIETATKDVRLNKRQLNQIRNPSSTPMKEKIAAFDAYLGSNGYPTTLETAGGGAPAGSSGGGKAKISGF